MTDRAGRPARGAIFGAGRQGRDRGAAEALGLVLMFPAMMGLAVLVLFLGRQVEAKSQVQAASDAAVVAASRQRTPQAAVAAARQAASALLADADACSGTTDVRIDATAWAAGGSVTAVVTCSPRLDDLQLIRPPARTFSASSTSLIDPYRSAALP